MIEGNILDSSKMLVKTVKRTVSRNDPNNEEFVPIEIIATIPTDIADEDGLRNNKRIPISLTFRNVNDSQEIAKLQCYHYAVPKRNSKEIVDIPLIPSVNDWVSEIARKITVATAKKYNRPCYVAWSSSQSVQNTTFPTDQLFILKKCINSLDSMLK